jgi:hypothetical protein
MLEGKSDWSVALGCRLNTALPRVGGVGLVRPDITELELVPVGMVREAVPIVPGTELAKLEPDELNNFLGLANLCSSGGRIGVMYTCIII